ncbi:Ig-like domain repeat protein [Cellulomonas endophytica]|uniref:Ig-like domain repeat protein n=1 Tax=Cellulomonas endophytica TaxID=2494735 RepID=UPI0010116556|nr:Ig-like domain repeat protein [Cellulomonas endophytica]
MPVIARTRPTATRARSARRPLAALGVLALLGVVVPAGAASAANSGSVSKVSGEEKVDGTATYGFSCTMDSGTGNAFSWRLMNTATTVEYQRGDATDYTVNTGTSRSGTFSITFTGLAAGTYRIQGMCWTDPTRSYGYVPAVAYASVAPGSVATTTSLSASPTTVVAGRSSTLTASVPGAPAGGQVEFLVDGAPVGTAPLGTGRTATLTRAFPTTAAVTARYVGASGYLPSTSAPRTVTALTTVVAPSPATLSAPVVVGTPVTVATGTWSPTVADGTALTYRWTVGGETVGTGASYTPVPADLGRDLAVDVTGTHPELAPGTSATVTGGPQAVGRGTLAAGALTLEGTQDGAAVLGTPLVVDPSGWAAGTGFVHRWSVGGADVPGATGPSYTPRPQDLGRPVAVTVTAQAPGMTDLVRTLDAAPAVVTPTLAVRPDGVVVGQDAPVHVTVAGPEGGPVPTGTVQVTLTAPDGATTVLAAPLVGGAADVTAPAPAVGDHAVTAVYTPDAGALPDGGTTAVAPYTTATGSATLSVAKASPTVTVPTGVSVPVATAGIVVARVAGARLPETFVLEEGGAPVLEGTVPVDGVLELTLPVLAPGTHELVLRFPEGASTLAAESALRVSVQGEPEREGLLPTAALATPEKATAPGQPMELVAEGFDEGETVAFYLHSDPVLLGTAVAGADGTARLLVTVPDTAPTGEHTVVATGGTSGRWAALELELAVASAPAPGTPTAPTTGTSPVTATVTEATVPATAAGAGTRPAATTTRTAARLAATGAETGAVTALAWGMVLLGGALVVVRRRRAHA